MNDGGGIIRACWVCGREFEKLSIEHIIPKFFGGIASTEKFSCRECNQTIGRIEQAINPLSVFMHYLDNADGVAETTIPKRGSRNKETRLSYGSDPTVELSSSGDMKSDCWERPSGKGPSGDRIWVPSRIPLNLRLMDLHKSMLKAILALACDIGFSRNYFDMAQEYLSGDEELLGDLKPVDLGLPPQEMFAAAWIFAPPSRGSRTIYGTVIYGPLAFLYSLRSDDKSNSLPFFGEVKAYSKKPGLGIGEEAYQSWYRTTVEKARQQAESMRAYQLGPFNVKCSQGSGLLVVETSPTWFISRRCNLQLPEYRLESTHGWGSRFENWLGSIDSEEEHSKFLSEVTAFEAIS